MTTYWIYPSIEEIKGWLAAADDTATIEVTVKCAATGDDTVERIYRHKGLSQVNYEFVAELFSPEEIGRMFAKSALVHERHKESGLLDLAREQLDSFEGVGR